MSAFKVGDRVLVRGTVLAVGCLGYEIRVRFGDGKRVFDWWVSPRLIEPATRAPWDVLREAADIVQADAWDGAADLLRVRADRLEAAARPPSLLEAAKEIATAWADDPHIMNDRMDRLRAAIAAAEREAGQ